MNRITEFIHNGTDVCRIEDIYLQQTTRCFVRKLAETEHMQLVEVNFERNPELEKVFLVKNPNWITENSRRIICFRHILRLA